MTEDEDDLLEIYDDRNKPEDNYFANSKKETSDFVYFLILIGFLICIAIKFIQSLNTNTQNKDAVIIRQVQLLKIIRDSNNENEVFPALQEYDSLEQVLESLN